MIAAAASLRRKVTLTLFGAFALALATAAIALAFFEYRSAATRARITLESLADSLAFSLVASIDFDQPAVTEGNLARLEPSRAVLGATVFRTEPDGAEKLFAHYQRAGIALRFPSDMRSLGFYQSDDRALLVYELRSENRLVGRLLLETDVSLYRRGLRESLAILGVVVLVLALVSVALSRLLQRTVTRPIMQLAETAARVHLTSDFALRAPVIGEDEVGKLAVTFNEMLASIAARDRHIAESTTFQRAILEATEVLVISTDPAGVVVTFNPASELLLGYAATEVIGQTTPALWHDPEEMKQYAAALSLELGETIKPGFEAFLTKPQRRMRSAGEWTFVRKDGQRIPVYLVISALRDSAGNITGYCGLASNLSERKAADDALRQSRALLNDSQRIAHIGSWEINPKTRVLVWSDETYRILGHEPQGIAPTPEGFFAQVFPADLPAVRQRLDALRLDVLDQSIEYRIVRSDGSIRWILATGAVEMNSAGQPVRLYGSLQDITDRKAADEKLRTSEAQYRSLIEEARDAIFTLSPEGKILDLNQAVETITGWQHDLWVGRNFSDPLRPEDQATAAKRFAEVLGGEHPPPFELQIRSRRGAMITLEFALSPRLQHDKVVGVLGVGRDVTERRLAEETKARLEQQLFQSQKMEAIGTLAGGIAHDFNNILSGIVGFASLARQAAGDNPELLDYLGEINRAGRRAAELVRQILAFSRTDNQALVPMQLRHVVAEAVSLLRAAIPSSIEFEEHLAQALPAVKGNATQLHQVVMNLGTNAWHAMRERPGRLSLRLEACTVDQVLADAVPGLDPGLWVRLSVSDTGCGMDQETQKRAFEPFFTTKAPGEGTGLGLSVVHGIVSSHHGAVRLTSEPGRGTTFEIFLPALASVQVPSSDGAGEIMRGHGERILLVDDEEPLVRLGVRTLEKLGYAVEGESQVRAALARLQAADQPFQLVLTDQTMPGLTGLDFAARIRELHPKLPVLLVSGYSSVLTPERVQAAGVREVLSKPFSTATLAAAIRRHLPPDPSL